MVTVYDAIWGFEEDILELRKNFKERILKAHLSQPWAYLFTDTRDN
jgi:hypothetical protein